MNLKDRRHMRLGVEITGRTDVGRVREVNEDSHRWESPATDKAQGRGALLVVADGMGGHDSGEVASALAVDTIHRHFYESLEVSTARALTDAIQAANAEIFARSRTQRGSSRMGTTVVAAVILDREVVICHAGDSRAALSRDGRVIRLTQDHSPVGRMVAEGLLTLAAARNSPLRSQIDRALGLAEVVEIDSATAKLRPGDTLILGTDGLFGRVPDEAIVTALRLPIEKAADELIDLANRLDGSDNVTVVVARVDGAKELDRRESLVPHLAVVSVMLILAFAIAIQRGGTTGEWPGHSPRTPGQDGQTAAAAERDRGGLIATPTPLSQQIPSRDPRDAGRRVETEPGLPSITRDLPDCSSIAGSFAVKPRTWTYRVVSDDVIIRPAARQAAPHPTPALQRGSPIEVVCGTRGQPVGTGSDLWLGIAADPIGESKTPRGFIHADLVRLDAP